MMTNDILNGDESGTESPVKSKKHADNENVPSR